MGTVKDLEKRVGFAEQGLVELRTQMAVVEATMVSTGGGGGAAPAPDTFPGLGFGGFSDRPQPAFTAWFLTGGDGDVGVSAPDGAVTYRGKVVHAGGDHAYQKGGPNDGIQYLQVPCGNDKETLFLLVFLPDAGLPYYLLEWAADADAARAAHSDPKPEVVVPVATYDDEQERLLQRHVGVVAVSSGGAEDLGPFRIYPSDSSGSGSGSGSGAGIDIGEGYVQVGGFTIWVEGREDFPTARHEIVAVDVVIDAYGHPSGELVEFGNFSALQQEQDDLDHVYIPIYKFDWGDDSSDSGDGGSGGPTLVMDLRRMPMTGALETFLDESSDDGSGGGAS